MTVSKDEKLYYNWDGDGSTTQFDFDFSIDNESQLVVMHTDNLGLQTTLELNKDYTIDEVGNDNGSFITFPIEGSSYGVATDEEIISIVLELPIEQTMPYEESDKLIKKRLERNFDYITKLLKIMNRKIERSIKVAEGSKLLPDDLFKNIAEAKKQAEQYAKKACEQVEGATELLNSVTAITDTLTEQFASLSERQQQITELTANALETINAEMEKVKQGAEYIKNSHTDSQLVKFKVVTDMTPAEYKELKRAGQLSAESMYFVYENDDTPKYTVEATAGETGGTTESEGA
ncbi:MAG: hypothetical protein DKM24_01100 [Candidatus Melainabacteria bacterium]|nr:MAG: hypothetical protein DKM24_01100 [Candidatus Melainabacteria bacterium]